MEIGTLFSGMSAAGSLLGGLGGLFGKKQKSGFNPKELEYQLWSQRMHALENARTMPTAMKEGWERAGIHPIYGMGGSSASFSPSFSVGSGYTDTSVGEGITRMGQGISRAAEALASNTERLQNRALETQIEGQEIENMKKASDLALKLTGLPPGIPSEFYDAIPMPLGYNKTAPLHTVAIDEKGNPYRVWNEEGLGDNEIGAAVHAMRYMLPDMAHNQIAKPIKRGVSSLFKPRSYRKVAKRAVKRLHK